MPDWIDTCNINRALDWAGFVYCITNTRSGRAYIGRKYAYALRNGRQVESNWRDYWGSCRTLHADLGHLGEMAFERRILSWYRTRREVNRAEILLMISQDVLGERRLPCGTRAYYNARIWPLRGGWRRQG